MLGEGNGSRNMTICLAVCLAVSRFLSVCLSVILSVSVCLSVCLPVYFMCLDTTVSILASPFLTGPAASPL